MEIEGVQNSNVEVFGLENVGVSNAEKVVETPKEASFQSDEYQKLVEAQISARYHAQKRLASGANWFYWIAALSLINTGSYLLGSGWNFIAGLGVTQLIDALAHSSVIFSLESAIVIDVFIAALFAMIGFFSNKRHNWAFIAGIIIYTLDALIFLWVQDWLSIAFHVFALSAIIKGLQANSGLKKMNS